MEKTAMSTIGTVLKAGASRSQATRLCYIKSYPDLGGTFDLLETTNEEEDHETHCPGVKTVDTIEFRSNYNPADFANLIDSSNQPGTYYRLEMGEDGEDGIFTWSGFHNVYVSGGNVDEVREMVVTIGLQSRFYMETDSGVLGDNSSVPLVTDKGDYIGFYTTI